MITYKLQKIFQNVVNQMTWSEELFAVKTVKDTAPWT